MRISGDNLIDLIDNKYIMTVMIIIEVILTCLVLAVGLGWPALMPMTIGLTATGIFIFNSIVFSGYNPSEIFKGEQLFELKFIRFWISLVVIVILIVMLRADL